MVGMIALLPHAIGVPVIAAGGIADAWGVAAALMLGASAVKIGTGFLRSPEAKIHRAYASRLAKTEAMRPSSRVPSVDGRAAAYYPGLFMNRRQIPVSRSEAPV